MKVFVIELLNPTAIYLHYTQGVGYYRIVGVYSRYSFQEDVYFIFNSTHGVKYL